MFNCFVDVGPMKFLTLGNQISKTKKGQKESTKTRRFKSFFGVTPHVCSIVWTKIVGTAPIGFQPKHLLWGLTFLKQYANEHNRHSTLKADEKTIRKWTWIAVKLMSGLKVVNVIVYENISFSMFIFSILIKIIWENRKNGAAVGQTAFCSLDGADFKIDEPTPFSPQWFSHKFHGPGQRYEVGLCVRTGHMVWVNGGYPCGAYSDLKIARQAYLQFVDPGERTFTDKGYLDRNVFILPNLQNKTLHGRIMARHETVNRRMKQFQALKQVFRHDRRKHTIVFNAVANLTQLMLVNGEPLFTI